MGVGNGLGSGNGGEGGSGMGMQTRPYSSVVIGGRQQGKHSHSVDLSGPSSDFKRKGKGKGKVKESSESIDSLRSEALKEFVEVN